MNNKNKKLPKRDYKILSDSERLLYIGFYNHKLDSLASKRKSSSVKEAIKQTKSYIEILEDGLSYFYDDIIIDITEGIRLNDAFLEYFQKTLIEYLSILNNMCLYYNNNKEILDSKFDSTDLQLALSPYYCTLNPCEPFILDIFGEPLYLDSISISKQSAGFNSFIRLTVYHNFTHIKTYLHNELGISDILELPNSLPYGPFMDRSMEIVLSNIFEEVNYVKEYKDLDYYIDVEGYLKNNFKVDFDLFSGFIKLHNPNF